MRPAWLTEYHGFFDKAVPSVDRAFFVPPPKPMSQFRQRQIAQSRHDMATPRPDRLLMKEVARATGVRVIEEQRPLCLDYTLPVPCKVNDAEPFDIVMKRDAAWLADRRKRERN